MMMRTLHHRLKLMSSPSLSDLGRSAVPPDDRNKQYGAGTNATWNRQLLKTELGSFFTEYLQNQLLTKGMVILRDKICFHEGQKLLDSLSETWDYFFCDVLSTLQALFYPVQGKEPSVRQLALLHFRNIITLNINLDEALSRPRARVPPSIVQMLLILQGVHECKSVSSEYLKLESLIQKVVSPYLGTHGLFSSDGSITQCSCVLEKRLLQRWPRSSDSPAKNPVVRSKSYNIPMLTPVAESNSDSGTGIRRHSVCQMTSCLEEPMFLEVPSSPVAVAVAVESCEEAGTTSSSPPIFPELCCNSGRDATPHNSRPSSPETVQDQNLESLDSDIKGIFIDFCRQRSCSSDCESVA
ncbi:proline-rich protein 5-like isoform X2 [Xyrauchen texanus]|uniref:proline-rich protein 5-like isoform X2 n=1 Tax=Xyrauchen texanus TaxID=154827 RepID=UPI0022424D85|nr:proline-rich protein 5-like isoform X2 [Xyrauchen texanus]